MLVLSLISWEERLGVLITIEQQSITIGRINTRLENARRIAIQSQIQLQISFTDFSGLRTHLSHDLIIELIHLVGPFYDMFADALALSRSSAINAVEANLTALTASIQDSIHDANHGNAQDLDQQTRAYKLQKRAICASSNTDIFSVALANGSTTDILSHPRHGLVYADNRVESQQIALSTMLMQPILTYRLGLNQSMTSHLKSRRRLI